MTHVSRLQTVLLSSFFHIVTIAAVTIATEFSDRPALADDWLVSRGDAASTGIA
ncbi:MAG: hypothetical protein RL069_1286, partial [Planctomycetota bacterium]